LPDWWCGHLVIAFLDATCAAVAYMTATSYTSLILALFRAAGQVYTGGAGASFQRTEGAMRCTSAPWCASLTTEQAISIKSINNESMFCMFHFPKDEGHENTSRLVQLEFLSGQYSAT
jgi:hypothetical protein